MRVLILGGTSEARELAAALAGQRVEVISSLAGRVRQPALPVGQVRVGGFSSPGVDGIEGLTAYLEDHGIDTLVDATHPFATTITEHAVAAAALTGVPLLRFERPGWSDHPDAGSWTWVDSTGAAVEAGRDARRPLLTTGRQSLADFLSWADKHVTVRVVDPPDLALPERWRLIRSRGPYSYDDERILLAEADLLVTKDSGGTLTVAKLDAARDLGVRVVCIRRPSPPRRGTTYASVSALLADLV